MQRAGCMYHHMQITVVVILQLMLNEYGSLCLSYGRGVGSVYSNKTRMNTDNQTTETANLLWVIHGKWHEHLHWNHLRRDSQEWTKRKRERERAGGEYMFTWISLAHQSFITIIQKRCSSLILADPTHCLDPQRMPAAMDQEKFVINWTACTWIISLPSLAQCPTACMAQLLEDFLQKKDITVHVLLHNMPPTIIRSQMLLVNGWVSLTQLQIISDHDSKQEGEDYM